MARFTVNGFVIRGFSTGESSRVITLFTDDRGKLKSMAKGVRKSASAKGGALELFSHVRCNVYLKENVELGKISSVDLIDDYQEILEDPLKYGFSSAFCEIVDKLTTADHPVPGLYNLMSDFFKIMMKIKSEESAVIFWASFMKVLSVTGYQPRLYECVVCGKKNEGRAAFYDSHKGGIICKNDLVENIQYDKLTSRSLKILQAFQSQEFPDIEKIDADEKSLGEIEQFIMTFADYHTGLRRSLKSFKFLSQLKAKENRRTSG